MTLNGILKEVHRLGNFPRIIRRRILQMTYVAEMNEMAEIDSFFPSIDSNHFLHVFLLLTLPSMQIRQR